jgi:hypothetical protein
MLICQNSSSIAEATANYTAVIDSYSSGHTCVRSQNLDPSALPDYDIVD